MNTKMTINSNTLTFIDTTDTKKIDVHISSNHPTVQLYDTNLGTYTPNWTSSNLVLSAKVYADSINVTDLKATSYQWFKDKDFENDIGDGTKNLTISTNILNSNTSIVEYTCRATYNKKEYDSTIVFTLITTGKNGVDGKPGKDGVDGQPGKSVGIKGVAYTNEAFVAGATVKLYSDPEYKNEIITGGDVDTVDGYLVDGYLCVYTGENFIWTGKIQGPRGDNGESTYLFTRYADDQNGSGFSDSPIGKKYIGFYRHSEKTLPSTVGTGYSNWAWVKYVGEDAKSISLSATTQVFRVGKDGTVSPSTLTITPQAVNTSITEWYYSRNGDTFSTTPPAGVVPGSDGKITITGASMTDDSISVRVSDGTYSDTLTIYKAYDGDKGEDASIVFLTNENITFAADSDGQVVGTTVYCDVVAYTGTTPVVPFVGVIDTTRFPDGMTLGEQTTTSEQAVRIPIIIADNTTLGSTQNIHGEIVIPIITPIRTDLRLTWSKVNSGEKGEAGVGISSVTVTYGVSTSASTQPTSWQSSVPTVADGSYLWTRTITDYTDNTVPDTVTYTYAKQGDKGDKGSTGSSVTVSKIEYQSGTSATVAPTSAWSNSVVSVAEGNYLWTKTTFSDSKVAYGVAKQGQKGDKGDKGDTGRGVSKITEYYLATTDSSGVTTSTSGWTTTIQSIDITKKYLWNYELITYTDNTISSTTPVIIGVFGNTGKGIKSVTEYYLATSSSSGVTTSTTGWKDTMQTLTSTNKYLWNYELITYTDNSTATINPVIIGVYGDQGIQGPKGNDAYTVMLTNESHIFAGDVSNAIAGSTTTQVLAYNGSTAQTVTIVSVNGKTAATTDTDTGIAGLKFKCSALSGASPTITFTCTTSFVSKSGTIPIVLSVGGVQFTKMFTYSIAFKGTTGNPGSPGAPASLVDITPSALYFKSTTGKDGTFTPDYIYLYPRFQTVTFSKWEYSINGGTTWVAASGANGLSISTYNSVANTLRIAKTSTLYTDTVTSISFRCVSSNTSVYDTVSIAKIYDVIDLRFEGRNLILNSNQSVTSDTYRTFVYDMSEDWIGGETYTISIKGSINEGQTFGVWANGSSTRVTTLTYDSSKDIYTSTFVASTSIATQIPKTLHVYNTPSDTATESAIEWIKLEKGSRLTNWLPAPEDLKSTTFQLYAPKGYLITNDVPEVTLQTFAYDGSQTITNATYKWYVWSGETWTIMSGATGTSLILNKTNVMKTSVYKCEMTYNGKVYEATATVEDKTDVYDSLINVVSKYSPTNRLYWVLSSTVYSEEGEKDELLGPVSVTAPANPTTGSYWYKIDEANYSVTLMKYSGSAWTTTTDSQELVYDWFLFKDINDIITLGAQSKVKIVTSNDFSRVCSVQCNVSDSDLIPLTHNNQILNDPSDPVVSSTEPTNPVNGQLWIKTGVNGVYTLLVWDASLGQWIVSEADSQVKIHINKPTSYEVGDVWVVGSDYEPTRYVNGVAQTTKYLAGTMLKAQYSSQTYKDSDWVEALNYKKEIDKLQENLNVYNQYFTFDETGMTMRAKNLSGQISEFSTKLTNNELGFYQGDNKVAYINNNQLNISKAEITNGMTISGVSPILEIGNFAIIQESNGSLSIGLKS